jgi:3-oxoacyl-[acyl-carrier protein] reductase
MTDQTTGALSVDLHGQSAIVTGASRGLGKTIALALAGAGANVACIARSIDKLKETADAIAAAGGTADVYECDVTNGPSVQQVVDRVAEKWEKIHILVNNAGITRDTLIPRMSDDDWDSVIDTNLRGTFLFTRAVTRPMMQARYGRIVNIASVSGVMGNPGQANYSASKAGIIGMTRTVAKELASRKITINAVAPGFIETEMTEAMGPAVLDEAKKRIPAKRLGRADEVAACVLFLASASAGYITGQVLVIDGGMTA